MTGDALGGLDCDWVSWFSDSFWVCSWSLLVLKVVVSFWVHSSCVIMMVPPPWAMRASARSWTGAGTSGAVGFIRPGAGIGRKVMVVVVFWRFRMDCMVLSIDCVVMLVVMDWVLLICLVERQVVVIRSIMVMATMWGMFVFFMVHVLCSKGNTFGKSVQ